VSLPRRGAKLEVSTRDLIANACRAETGIAEQQPAHGRKTSVASSNLYTLKPEH